VGSVHVTNYLFFYLLYSILYVLLEWLWLYSFYSNSSLFVVVFGGDNNGLTIKNVQEQSESAPQWVCWQKDLRLRNSE